MTIQEARDILKDDAEGLSDEQIQEEIETATLFKNIFFELHLRKSGK